MHQIDTVLEKIADLYYIKATTRHDTIPKLISQILKRLGFRYKREYELDSGYRLLYGRGGFIDVVAWKNYNIGIEFDSARCIRKNSMKEVSVS